MKNTTVLVILLVISTLLLSCKTEKKETSAPTEVKPTVVKESSKMPNVHFNEMIKTAIDEALKTSTRVNIDSIVKDLTLIKNHSFYKISLGDSIKSHFKKLKKEELSNGESDFTTYTVYGEHNEELAIIHTDSIKKGIIKSIEIISKKAKTKKGISIGQTLYDLIKEEPNIVVHGSENEGRTVASHDNIYYVLDIYLKEHKVDLSKVRKSAKIKSIIIK